MKKKHRATLRLKLVRASKAEQLPSGNFSASWAYHFGFHENKSLREAFDAGYLPSGGHFQPGYLSFSGGHKGFTSATVVYFRRLSEKELNVKLSKKLNAEAKTNSP